MKYLLICCSVVVLGIVFLLFSPESSSDFETENTQQLSEITSNSRKTHSKQSSSSSNWSSYSRESTTSSSTVSRQNSERGIAHANGGRSSAIDSNQIFAKNAALVEKYKSFSSDDFSREIEKLHQVDTSHTKEELIVLASVWATKAPEEALEFFKNMEFKSQSVGFAYEREILKSVATANPSVAVNEIIRISEEDDNRSLFLTEYISATASGWAQSDPNAAFEWLNSLDFEQGVKAFNEYMTDLTEHNSSLAFDQINQLDPDKQAEAIKGVSINWGQRYESWDSINDMINELPEDIQDEAFRSALTPFSENHPSEAMELISAIPENNNEKNRIVARVLNNLEDESFQSKVEWALENSTDAYTSHINEVALVPWINDAPYEVLRWLQQQPASEQSDRMIDRFLSLDSVSENYKKQLRASLEQ